MNEAAHLPAQCSVVFLRIHDYLRRPVAEQARLNAQLDTVLALLLPDLSEPSRIILGGNGNMALAILENPPAALTIAERALKAADAGLDLCIGIDHGPLEVITSEKGELVSGDGIATASLLAASAPEGTLLASKNFRIALSHKAPGTETSLIGSINISDTALRTYQVYTLDRQAPARRRRAFVLIALMTSLLLFAAAFAVRQWMPDRPRPFAFVIDKPAPAAPERPIIRFNYVKP